MMRLVITLATTAVFPVVQRPASWAGPVSHPARGHLFEEWLSGLTGQEFNPWLQQNLSLPGLFSCVFCNTQRSCGST